MPEVLELVTYDDLIIQMIDFMDANPSPESRRDARRAIESAMRVFPNEFKWTYYSKLGRIVVNASVQGAITYDHTGGSSERLVTWNTASIPSWAAQGVLVIGEVAYEVAERVSDTEFTLSITSNPGEDLAAGTTATLFRDTYPMPSDFVTVDQMYATDSTHLLEYVHPRDWLRARRFNVTSTNTPFSYTIVGDPNFQGAMAVRFYPFPDTKNPIDFYYQRRGRVLRIEGVFSGTINVTQGSSLVTGIGTNFKSEMIGSVIRVSGNKVDLPTSRVGVNPFEEERVVMAVNSTTELEVDQDFDLTFSDVRYLISDPLDMDSGAMFTAFIRLCEREVGIIRKMQDRQLLFDMYSRSLVVAKETDSRSTAPRGVGSTFHFQRLADMPLGPDVD